MNIEQLSREYEILPTVHEVVKLTKDITGKDLEFQLLINFHTDAVTKIARAKMNKHIVKIKENSTHRVNHIIIHECGHILRMMKANPHERVIPSTNNKTLEKAFNTVKQELSVIPFAVREKIFEYWSSGLISQLINLPVDVRIEKWIYKNYPTFRDVQKKSLKIDVKNCLIGLSDKTKENVIETIFNKSNAMVYAYLKGISSIAGEDYASYFNRYSTIKNKGEKLYACLESKDKGFTQDIKIINAWAKILNIKEWFVWIGFEDVPESYFE